MYKYYIANKDRHVTELDMATYMQLKELMPAATEIAAVCLTTKVTGKGQQHFINIFLKKTA